MIVKQKPELPSHAFITLFRHDPRGWSRHLPRLYAPQSPYLFPRIIAGQRITTAWISELGFVNPTNSTIEA
jgi:hypothetical protein